MRKSEQRQFPSRPLPINPPQKITPTDGRPLRPLRPLLSFLPLFFLLSLVLSPASYLRRHVFPTSDALNSGRRPRPDDCPGARANLRRPCLCLRPAGGQAPDRRLRPRWHLCYRSGTKYSTLQLRAPFCGWMGGCQGSGTTNSKGGRGGGGRRKEKKGKKKKMEGSSSLN